MGFFCFVFLFCLFYAKFIDLNVHEEKYFVKKKPYIIR